MKKFYSFVLMAMMLLVGTNAWANYPAGWLQQQFDNIQADGQTHTIVMGNDIILTDPVYLGTATVDEDRKSIILDMHGHNITMDATTWSENHKGVFCSVFNITHGELLIKNSQKSTTTSLIQFTGTGSGNYNDIFNIAGSYKSSRWVKNGSVYEIDESAAKNTRDADGGWFTHLVIDEGVKLYAPNTVFGAGISIDGYYTNFRGQVSPDGTKESVFGTTSLTGSTVCLYNREDAPRYNTAIMSEKSGGKVDGFGYGIRVEVYGDIEFASDATNASKGKSYGIKLNGGLRSTLKTGDYFHPDYCKNMDEAYIATYGATEVTQNNLVIDSVGTYREYYFNHRGDTVDAPFLYIGKNARIIAAAELNEATAIYCSGYGKTLIEGACSGNSGVNVKSGTVELHDAEITCTATATSVYKAENGNNATGTGAVVVNSVDGRAGGIEVIISGDSKVSTDYGYAIKETVTATDNETKVSSISIEGGTIQGGAATETSGGGAIIVSKETKNEVVIYGANLTGNNHVEVGGEGTLTDLLPKNEQTSEPEGHVTPVLDPVTGKTTLVISAGAAPDPGNWVSKIDDTHPQIEGASVKWITNTVDAISGYLKLTELEINDFTDVQKTNPREQTLTIQSGATLEVGRVILGPEAHIIVKAGGKLVVTGKDGIIANQKDNITLESSESAQAIFLFNPAVSSNRHPKATVQLTSKGYLDGTKKVWQRFGIPSYTTNTEADAGAVTRAAVEYDNVNAASSFDRFDYAQDKWVVMKKADDEVFVPFQCYEVTSLATAPGTVYTFKCRLMGNESYTLPIYSEWNYYANSYMAPIDIKEMLSDMTAASKLDGTIYVYRSSDNWWDAVNQMDFSGFFGSSAAQTTIDPMQAFIFKSREGESDAVVNYEEHIYNPLVNPSAGVPARNREVSAGTAMIEIAAADGAKDVMYLVESDQFSAEYDNGYDASKYMNGESFNLFASVNDEKMAKVATDNLEGTVLGMNTKEQTSFTMTISHVNNINYAIRDNFTGTEIEMVEGATYMFSTAANANIEGRFEIVPVAKMPTAIENIEATAAAKGIYTVTGQFVGNDYHSLPNGIYVVDGKKIVK